MNTYFGCLSRALHAYTDQAMTDALAEMELTGAQGHIISYLSHCKEAPCPRDIEKYFELSHPTVSGLLARLEKKGFIQLCTDADDRRCKRIYLLEKGQQCHAAIHRHIEHMEERIAAGFTEEEKQQLTTLLRRAIENLKEDPTQ